MNLTESVKSNRDIAVIVLLLIILLNILNFIPFYRIDPHSENKLLYYHGHVSSVNENIILLEQEYSERDSSI